MQEPPVSRTSAAVGSTAIAATETPSTERTPGWTRRLGDLLLLQAVLTLAAAVALAAFSIDVPLAQWCAADRCPRWLHYLLEWFVEPFGEPIGAALVAALIYRLDSGRRWALPRLLACALTAGLAADVVKLLIVRARPYHFDFQGDVWTTFGQWLPLTSAGSAGQSLPSGHTATAAGLALALIWLYPRGRWLFLALAVLVGCQRVESAAHYLSDVLFGAALGCLVAGAWLRTRWLAGWCHRWESRWQGKLGIGD